MIFALPANIDDASKEKQLEYSIVRRYAQKHWKKFDLIKARDIIITYILENEESLARFYKDIGDELYQNPTFADSIRQRLKECQVDLKNKQVDDYDEICQKIDDFLDMMLHSGLEKSLLRKNDDLNDYITVLRTKDTTRLQTRADLSLFVYTKYVLPIIGKCTRDRIKNVYTRLFQRYGNEIRFFGTMDVTQWK